MIASDGESRAEADVELVAKEQAQPRAERDVRRIAGFLEGAPNGVGIGAVLKGISVDFHSANDRNGRAKAVDDVIHAEVRVEDAAHIVRVAAQRNPFGELTLDVGFASQLQCEEKR